MRPSRCQLRVETCGRGRRHPAHIFIAHRLSTVQSAELICVMDAGRIVEVGSHAKLLARDGAYARLCRTQLIAPADGRVVQAGSPPA